MTVQTTTFGMLNKPSRVLSVTLWVAQILLALLFGGAGYNHAFASLDTLAQMGATWALQAPIWLVRFIGIAELAGTAGIILPALTRIRPGLTPLAAPGFAVIQLLAIPVHIVRSEFGVLPFNCVLLALSLFVLWGRGRKARIQPRG